jgi:hypothetical protein
MAGVNIEIINEINCRCLSRWLPVKLLNNIITEFDLNVEVQAFAENNTRHGKLLNKAKSKNPIEISLWKNHYYIDEPTPFNDIDFNVILRFKTDDPYKPLQLTSTRLLMLLFEQKQMRRMQLCELPNDIDNRNFTNLEYNPKSTIKHIKPTIKNGSISHNTYQEFLKHIPHCSAVGGTLKYFISKAAHGGRVFAKKGIYDNVTLLDINSLYPKALAELQIPTTAPHIWTENIDLNNVLYYVIDIDIANIKNKQYFYSYIKTGLRTVDKYELEDLIKYCNIEYNIIKGYYWIGASVSVKDFINELYVQKERRNR